MPADRLAVAPAINAHLTCTALPTSAASPCATWSPPATCTAAACLQRARTRPP